MGSYKIDALSTFLTNIRSLKEYIVYKGLIQIKVAKEEVQVYPISLFVPLGGGKACIKDYNFCSKKLS
jgi:hypothetical protein